ncbi:MAG: preprotein translocase subunit SecG [Pseudomonadales bacterium]
MELQVLETIVLVAHVLAALAIIGLVLIQQGRGAEMGSGFGGGASNTVFGSGGSGNFLTRLTTTLAIAFFLTSFGLAYFAREHSIAARDVGIPGIVTEQNAPAGSLEGTEGIEGAEAIEGTKGTKGSSGWDEESEVPLVLEPGAEPEIPEG